MSESTSGYWSRKAISRRSALRAAALAGGGLVALSLAGCGGDDDDAQPSPSTTQTQTLDSTKGKPGGKLRLQGSTYGGGLVLVSRNNAATSQLAGFTHSGLLAPAHGRPVVEGVDTVTLEPDLAVALPEQIDNLTYRFRIKPAKFHNGRTVTSEDVKYSFDRYATWETSAHKSQWSWLDKVEAPDAQTVVVKTKYPYADAKGSMCARSDAFIFAKEHEESPEASNKLMGSGAFLFESTQPPVLTRFRKNPDYFEKPYPYFDELEVLGQIDAVKKVSDFISRQVDVTYWHGEEDYEQITSSRPDAQVWRWPAPGSQLVPRVDQAPMNDKRVRQAMSMSINRKAIRDAVTRGRGEPDHFLSWTVKSWGLPKPADLGAAAKYWNHDPQAAKQLMSAAGASLNDIQVLHWDASHIGQGIVDQATLSQANWRDAGLGSTKDREMTFAQYAGTAAVGNYDGIWVGPAGTLLNLAIGINLKNVLSSPPEGVRPPTQNQGHINDPKLTALAEKQLGQLNLQERKQTLREILDLFSEEQYRINLSTYFYNYFGNPAVKNAQMPVLAFNHSIGFVKYWWLE